MLHATSSQMCDKTEMPSHECFIFLLSRQLNFYSLLLRIYCQDSESDLQTSNMQRHVRTSQECRFSGPTHLLNHTCTLPRFPGDSRALASLRSTALLPDEAIRYWQSSEQIYVSLKIQKIEVFIISNSLYRHHFFSLLPFVRCMQMTSRMAQDWIPTVVFGVLSEKVYRTQNARIVLSKVWPLVCNLLSEGQKLRE